ncbi:MAG: Ig-like domain-containing protein, partial [Tepidisphaeraceae bacterium]
RRRRAGYLSVHFAHSELQKVEQRRDRPRITLTRPAPDATDVSPLSGIVCNITIPSGSGVDENTLEGGVMLTRTRDGAVIPSRKNTSGAGDDVVLNPIDPLDTNTQYQFDVTDQLKDNSGASFDPYRMTFTTAKEFSQAEFPAAWEKVELAGVKLPQDRFTTLALGPDGLLYAGTFAGMIYRYQINPDGTLAPRGPVTTILKANHGPRLVTGIAFNPADGSLWVSHGQFAIKNGRPEGADDWTGKISRLTGPQFDQCQDVVVGLPRAYKDHLNFQLAFGPDGALYFNQGSNTSVGDIDKKWGYRHEHLLTAACLRLDLSKLALDSSPDAHDKTALPLNVKTEDGGTYNPAAPGAPLTLYATGIRSGFHLLFHSNGHLYTGVNGAAGNEVNTPPPPDGSLPAVKDIKQTTDDMLLDIQPGVYYGHPNPSRGQYILNGGNPTAGPDPMEVPEYPVGTKPDPHWQPPAYDFGKNYSPNGLIEYHDKSFNGALEGCILVTRYSDGKDILVLRLDPAGHVIESIAGLDGFTKFQDPLDILEDPKTGNLYLTEYQGQTITLLKPIPGGKSEHTQRFAVGK